MMIKFDINKFNQELSLPDYDVLLVGDGSGSKAQEPSGWACIRYIKATNKFTTHYGCSTVGTNNFAELMPFVHVLWLDDYEKHIKPRKIVIVSDSELSVKCGMGEYERNANLMLWNSLDYLATVGYDIKWKHVRRNTNPLNALCDKLAGRARKEIVKLQLTDDEISDIV